VTALDISSGSVEVAARRARLHGVSDRCSFVVGEAERLPFADGSFDVVVGKAVLHHLDVALAAAELERVMRPGARAAFTEPLGTNPVLGWARDHIPYPGKNPVGDDEPLTDEVLVAWQGPFELASKREIQLLSMAGRALGRRPPAWLVRADDALLARFPRLRRYCRYVVLTMRKADAVEPRFTAVGRAGTTRVA
jgi:SAM-dependent methyltransferase